ncbi:MAG TPA: ribulose-phosphate 3-epimerase [Cytophagaceae bacterium]
MDKIIVAPSVLAADFANLQRDIEMINESEAQWAHIDIMDGMFVPNISFGMPVVEAIQKHCKKVMDVHLMILQPERYIERFIELGAEVISVHIEASPHLHRVIQQIKALGCKAGVALNPHTPISTLEDILPEVDVVNLMSVNPGFGGQQFIPSTLQKIRKLREMINSQNLNVLIEIDGGVNKDNAAQIIEAGANVLVAGNFVFKSPDPLKVISSLRHLPAK